MSIVDTVTSGISSAASSITSKFHYGHHPSIIMWSNGAAVQKSASSTKSLSSVVTKLEDTISGTSGVPESFSSLKFDAMMSEGHDAEITVTKKPTSAGFLVSDGIIIHNRVLKLEAVAVNMQNSALWSASLPGLSVISGAIFNNPVLPLVGSLMSGVASAFETQDRIQSTYNTLRNLQVTGTKLYVSTILGPYTNCIITSLKTKHDKMTSAILAIEITMEELQVVGAADINTTNAIKAMSSMYDYSEFAKMAQSLGMGVLGGVSLPGLGALGSLPTTQLATLKTKLSALASPLSSVKGSIL